MSEDDLGRNDLYLSNTVSSHDLMTLVSHGTKTMHSKAAVSSDGFGGLHFATGDQRTSGMAQQRKAAVDKMQARASA